METTRDMKMDEPGSTGTSKLAMITGPDGLATVREDSAPFEVGKKLRASNKKNAQNKPSIAARRILLLCFSKLSSDVAY